MNGASDSGSRNDDESILGSSLSNTDSGSGPGSNSGSTNDDSDSGSRNDDKSILGSSLSNTDSGSGPRSNSGSTNDAAAAADDDGGGDGELSQTGSSSFRAC